MRPTAIFCMSQRPQRAEHVEKRSNDRTPKIVTNRNEPEGDQGGEGWTVGRGLEQDGEDGGLETSGKGSQV